MAFLQNAFQDYVGTFIQRFPWYTVKSFKGGHWRTKRKPLADTPVKAHLEKKYAVGVLSKWYPDYAILDIDERPIEVVREIRDKLGLNENNSMLCTSESSDSYHLLISPQYNDKPPTTRLLHDVLTRFGEQNQIEIYPQASRAIRLPFGGFQECVDLQYQLFPNWPDKLYSFKRLDRFNLSLVKGHQLELPLALPGRQLPKILHEGSLLLTHGLQMPSTRHESQFKILYFLWRRNVTQEQAEEIVWRWICKKHNGFSKDIVRHPQAVKAEISRQAARIWGYYEFSKTYPDSTHNAYGGYLTAPDLREIVEICKGSVPRMRFLCHLVKYFYPRRHQGILSLHTDKLVQWSNERTYLKYLNELKVKGIAERGKAYEPGAFSKSLRLNWKFRSEGEAVLYEGRAVETLEDSIRLVFGPEDFRVLLKKAGVSRAWISEIIQGTFTFEPRLF